MKKLLLVFVTFYSFSLFSQYSDRVLEIKKMYKETKSFDDKKTVRLLGGRRLMKMMGMNASKRKVTGCIYPKSYTRISLSFEFLNPG